jgi:hypothetical protein
MKPKTRALIVIISVNVLFVADAQAEEKEPTAVIEIGAAGERSLAGNGFGFGASAAVEFTVIKDWLEIEAGASTISKRSQTEWGTELLFKKPFTLSDKAEFMFGVGPAWTYTTGGEGAKMGAEIALDFMFWPWPERKFGWFLEPSYSYSFSAGHEQSLGVSVGLLIAIP